MNYPYLPIVHFGRLGYFPVEFLYHSLTDLKGANSTEQVKFALDFHDRHAGKDSIDSISRMLFGTPQQQHDHAKEMEQMLARMNIKVERKPKEVKAEGKL